MTQIHPVSSVPPAQSIPIRPAASATLSPPAKPSGPAGGYPRPFANESRNSRVTAALPHQKWKLLWQAQLESDLSANFVLQEGDRVLIPGSYQWLLFATDGTLLKKGGLTGGDVFFDRAHNLFYATSPSSMIVAYHCGDGAIAFATNGYGGKHNTHAFIVRRGNLLIDVSPGTFAQPRRDPVVMTGIQVQDVGESQQVDVSGILQNAAVLASEPRESARLLSTMNDDSLILAFKDRIQVLDMHLRIQTELTGQFDPQAMSLDESGRIHLIVNSQSACELWIITPTGERVASVTLPPQNFSTPPIIGYDHRIYLTDNARVTALSPAGKQLWERPLPSPAAGAIVTADDRLLVSSGRQIISFDPDGKETVLYSLVADQIRTPPVLTAQGQLLFATGDKLYCLHAAGE